MAEIVSERKLCMDAETGHIWREYAVLECDCGNELDLRDPLDNTCDQCGRNYNMSGQLVYHSRDPRVDEPYWED